MENTDRVAGYGRRSMEREKKMFARRSRTRHEAEKENVWKPKTTAERTIGTGGDGKGEKQSSN